MGAFERSLLNIAKDGEYYYLSGEQYDYFKTTKDIPDCLKPTNKCRRKF